MKSTEKDWYGGFEHLSASEREGVDYHILVTARPSAIAVIAPHGGEIEPNTSEIAAAIAGERLSLYLLED